MFSSSMTDFLHDSMEGDTFESVANAQSFPLLSLPPEIRAIIFRYFYSSSAIFVHVRDGPCRPYCHAGRLSTAVNLLLTSRQVHAEGSAYFHEATFVFTVPGLHGGTNLNVVPRSIMSPMRNVAVKSGIGSEMVNLSNKQVLDYFPALDHIKIWSWCGIRRHFESFKKFIQEEKEFEWHLMYKKYCYRYDYIVIIDHQHNVDIFVKPEVAAYSLDLPSQDFFGLSHKNIRSINTSDPSCLAYWGDDMATPG